MTYRVVTPCPFEPVSLAEMKLHSRVDIADDDEYLQSLVAAARRYVEQTAWLTLMPATLELALQAWPAARFIELPQGPISGVVSVKYDTDGGEQTLASGAYIVDTALTPGRVVLKRDQAWPSVQLGESSPIRVRYTAGYTTAQLASNADEALVTATRNAIPINLRHAIKLIAAHLYENREQVVAQVGLVKMAQLPLGVDALISPERAFRW